MRKKGESNIRCAGKIAIRSTKTHVTPLFLKVNRSQQPCGKNGYRPTGRIGCFFGMPLFEYSKSV